MGRSTTPSARTHRSAHHPINDTREAAQLSDLSPQSGAPWAVLFQGSVEAERNALGQPCRG
jgi:hypothetical protein